MIFTDMTNCGDIIPQNYQVSYDVNKVYYWDISEGDINKFKKNTAFIGAELAFNLDLKIGDKINLMSSAFITTPFGGLPKQETMMVTGIFNTGFYEFDQNVIFLNLKQTLNFFNKTEEDIYLEIYLQNPLQKDYYHYFLKNKEFEIF